MNYKLWLSLGVLLAASELISGIDSSDEPEESKGATLNSEKIKAGFDSFMTKLKADEDLAKKIGSFDLATCTAKSFGEVMDAINVSHIHVPLDSLSELAKIKIPLGANGIERVNTKFDYFNGEVEYISVSTYLLHLYLAFRSETIRPDPVLSESGITWFQNLGHFVMSKLKVTKITGIDDDLPDLYSYVIELLNDLQGRVKGESATDAELDGMGHFWETQVFGIALGRVKIAYAELKKELI